MKENRINYLLKNTSIFAISNISTKIIVFLLVPLYTYCLTTEEYGTVDLLFTISSFLVPILTLNISEAVYRFSLDKDANNNKIVSISGFIVICSLLLSLLVIPIFSLFPQYEVYKYYFYFYLISSILSQLFLVNLKGQEKLKLFSIGNILNTILIAILNIILLKFYNKKIDGYFLAYTISNFITFFYAFIAGKVLPSLRKFQFDKKLFVEMTKYSIVLIPTSFMWWIINSSDRIMVTSMVSSSANGIYAVSYKIPSILTTIAGIFNQAWMFSAISEKDSIDKEKFTNKVFRTMYIFIFIISVFILTFLKPFFKIYVESEFYSAWKFVPILVFGSVFLTFGTFVSTSYNVYKDSKGFLFSGLFGAFINILLNFMLIPLFNVYGAAIATCISYIGVFIYRIIDTKKYLIIRWNKDYILPIVILLICCTLLYVDSIYSLIIQFLILIAMIIRYKNDWIPILKRIFKR